MNTIYATVLARAIKFCIKSDLFNVVVLKMVAIQNQNSNKWDFLRRVTNDDIIKQSSFCYKTIISNFLQLFSVIISQHFHVILWISHIASLWNIPSQCNLCQQKLVHFWVCKCREWSNNPPHLQFPIMKLWSNNSSFTYFSKELLYLAPKCKCVLTTDPAKYQLATPTWNKLYTYDSHKSWHTNRHIPFGFNLQEGTCACVVITKGGRNVGVFL